MKYRRSAICLAILLQCVSVQAQPAATADQQLDRWFAMIPRKQYAQILTESEPILKATNDAKLRSDILFIRARAGILSEYEPAAKLEMVEQFIKSSPKDDRSAELLFRFGKVEAGPVLRSALFERAVREYPASYWGIMSKGMLNQIAGLGKPFELEFNDAINAKSVSLQRDMKGKVVVVYFWATWCSDCAAELPKVKQLYSQFKDRGVEFVGVSVDESEDKGGLTSLKDYVHKNEMPWPQFYQGKKFDSEFSSKWGVSSTPTVFIVDRAGNLQTTTAAGQIERLIPQFAESK